MLPTTQLIKKYWIYAFFLFAAAWSGYTFLQRRQAAHQVESVMAKTFQTPLGWGYDVYKNGALFIHQEYMPALDGRKGFENESQALRSARLVISKMNGPGLPVLSREEVLAIIK